jgi:2-C-methyl-D-erythritol 4-phosphate cytidylyltransferase
MALSVGLILAAGGVGKRFGGVEPKQFADLGGQSILHRAAERLLERAEFSRLVVTAPKGFEGRTGFEVARLGGQFTVVTGGKQRWQSVRYALKSLGKVDLVVVHDVVRPFVTRKVMKDTLAAALVTGAAVAALPASDTVKLSTKMTTVKMTLDRRRVWLVQTPQCFRYGLLRQVYDQEDDRLAGATDDAQLVESAGRPVKLIPGHRQLFKINTPDDLRWAELLLQNDQVVD